VKIVINVCYGGFDLSKEAKLKLFELGCPHTRAETPDVFFGQDRDEKERESHLRMFRTPVLEDRRLVVDDHRGDYKARTCETLIRVVEEMGEKASGRFGEIKVIEIPDDVDYEITEYDGWEKVEEKHRSWG